MLGTPSHRHELDPAELVVLSYRDAVPLDEAVLIPEDAGQLALLDDGDAFANDCEGGCGL